jgi:isopentenyl-diphosphate Delta-isomerase
MEQVILVDEEDNELGTMEKLQAHLEGRLHRAISVFIYNSKGELLLQQRALDKYHSAGLWTNTCCSHPRPGESANDAATRRLHEEMGLRCELKELFSFVYWAHMENNLIEHEYDHIFAGVTDTTPLPDASEVQGWEYVNTEELIASINADPGQFTEWFKMLIRDKGKELLGNGNAIV